MNTLRSLYGRFHQLIKFSIVGILNTIVDFGVFTFIGYVISLFAPNSDALIFICIANAVSLFAWVTNSYFINRKWTFEQTHKPNIKEAAKFYFVNSLSFFASTAIIYFLCNDVFPEGLKFGKLLGKVCAAPVVIFINFLGSKYFAFSQTDASYTEKE